MQQQQQAGIFNQFLFWLTLILDLELHKLKQQENVANTDSSSMLDVAQSQSVQLEIALAAAKANEETLRSELSAIVSQYSTITKERDQLVDKLNSLQSTQSSEHSVASNENISISLAIVLEEAAEPKAGASEPINQSLLRSQRSSQFDNSGSEVFLFVFDYTFIYNVVPI